VDLPEEEIGRQAMKVNKQVNVRALARRVLNETWRGGGSVRFREELDAIYDVLREALQIKRRKEKR
jgi:hypothetical protein